MNCRRVVNLMSAYVDGELTGEEMLAIRRHLSECEECAEELESMRMMKMAVTRLRSVTPREDFAASILKQLSVVEVSPYQKFLNSLISFVHKKLSPVAAAVAASGVALVILSAGGVETPVPVAQMNETEMASAPIAMQATGVRYGSEYSGNFASIPSSEPLRVADDDSFGSTTLKFANLSTR